MKDIHDANLGFFSPQPYFVAAFFFPQQLFQLAWLYRLWKLDAGKKNVGEKELDEVRIMTDFVPFYVVGNLCVASWMIFWNSSALKLANLFVLINSLTQLTYIFTRLTPMNTRSTPSALTHIVSKTFAGIGVLDLLHNGSVAYFDHQGPNLTAMVLTGVGFAALAGCSDWIFGACLVYDLVAIAVGQRGIGEMGWSNLLGLYALGAAGIVVLRNVARPPYVSEDRGEYVEAATEDEVL